MTETDFLSLLNSIDFSRRYWELCDHFPDRPTGQPNLGRKEDVLAAFAEVGVKPRYRQRTFEFDNERIGEFTWSGTFVKQHNGVELVFDGESNGAVLGSNFAVLAYNAQCLADPTFKRDPFSGPPPYPRPAHYGDLGALKEIVKQQRLA